MKFFYALILLALICVLPVCASNVTPETALAYNSSTIPERIVQGQCVELGKVYDITGVIGWSDKFSYYGRYDTDLSPENGTYDIQTIIEHPMTVRLLSRYYIDPDYFETRVGMWYQASTQNTRFESNGNLRAFRVNYTCPQPTIQTPTIAQQSANASTNITYLPLPSVHVSDLLVAKGDNIYYPAPEGKTVWIFGTDDKLYDIGVNNSRIDLKAKDLVSLSSGEYKIVVLNGGKNGIIEAKYDPESGDISSPFRNTPTLNDKGIAPKVMFVKFVEWMQKYSDDKITILTMQVQDPYNEIQSIDVDDPIANYGLIIKGYTNLDRLNKIYAVIDEDVYGSQLATKHYGAIFDDVAGNMHQFIIKIPVDINSFPTTDSEPVEISVHAGGMRGNVPFWVYEIPEGQQKPDQHIKYIGGNLFVPTPTPVIIKMPAPPPQIVTIPVTITVPVTPTDEQVHKANFDNMVALAGMAIVGTLFVCVAIYVVSAWTRRKG